MNETVLVVDDSLTVRMDLADAFDSAGFHPVACSSLGAAREALCGGAVAAVVLDVQLPDGDGIELLRELRRDPGAVATPVLVLSTEAEVKDRIRGLETGADEYVGKPYDRNQVVARTRELLRRRRGREVDDRLGVLLIDDSETFRAALCDALEQAGYSVTAAGSGEEGLRLAADRRPAAVIVDGVLPGIDGSTVIRHLRLDAALRSIPCLLLTGSEDIGAELRALDAGADAFVRKEEDIEVILARLAAALRRTGGQIGSDAAESLLGPKRILAVDDSATYLEALAEALAGEGYDLALARSGEEALELLAVQPVDGILIDLMMPGLGGQETCRRVKATPGLRDIPLIMLTAREDRQSMLEGLSAGADDYVQKSSEMDVLRARVRAQLRRKQLHDENRRIREELLQAELKAARERAARELAETRAALVGELERKNQELEAFSYSVSHDLRAPLRAIDGFSQALVEDYGEALASQAKEYLRRIRGAAQRMGELIDDLLGLSRVGRVEMRPERVDLSLLARQALFELRKREPDRRVEVRIEEGIEVEADAGLMRIVLENLLGNAWKFTARVGSARIELKAREAPTEITCSVSDNGAGFDMVHSQKLFRPFQRLHAETEFPGTGIGLATVQRILDRHGGRAWAEGSPGAGASVHFSLPKGRGGAS